MTVPVTASSQRFAPEGQLFGQLRLAGRTGRDITGRHIGSTEMVIDIRIDAIAGVLEYAQRSLCQTVAGGFALTDQSADNMMCLTERYALAHEVFGQGGGVKEAGVKAVLDTLGLEGGVSDDSRGHGQAPCGGVGGIEQLLFVFLHVAVIGQRLALEHGQQGREVAIHPAGLAADEFEHVGVALLRHHGAARAIGVIGANEAELAGGIDDPVFGQP